MLKTLNIYTIMKRITTIALFCLVLTLPCSSHPLQPDQRTLQAEITPTSSLETVHAVINIICWGFLIDIGIVMSRLGKGRKITIGGRVVPAQAIHASIMVSAFLLSGILTILMLSRSSEEKMVQDILYDGSVARGMHKVVGYIIGILTIIVVGLGCANILFLKDYNRNIRSKLTITKAHKLLGTVIYILTKVNLILGPVFFQGGDWKVPVYVFLAIMAPLILVVPNRLRKQYWTPKRLAEIIEVPSSAPKHRNLLSAINSGYSAEEIMKDFPGIKWMLLGNKVYDVTDWIHPAGNFTIEPCVGKEIGRYFYGNYALEGTTIKAHKHSSLSMAQLSTFYIGEMKHPESILISTLSGNEAISYWNNTWKIKNIKLVSPTTSQIDFVNQDFKVKNFGSSLSWLGAHFKVSFANDKSMARMYTAAMCLNEANYQLRQNMYAYFDQVMAGHSASFKYPRSYLEPQESLPLYIKNYMSTKKGFSRAIHNKGQDTPIRIEGPILGNLIFSPKAKGEYCIICAGTGILSIIDFLCYFLWKNMYEILKEKVGEEKAQEINMVDIPFESLNQLKIDFIGSFPNKEEILGLDIIKKLAEISKKFKKDSFTARIRGYSDENIQGLNQHFSYDFLRKNVNLYQTRYFVVGPRQLNEQVAEALISLGVLKGKIILL